MKRRSRSLCLSLLLAVVLMIASLTGCRNSGPAESAPQENAAVLQTITDDEKQGEQETLSQIEADSGPGAQAGEVQEVEPGEQDAEPEAQEAEPEDEPQSTETVTTPADSEDTSPAIDEDGSYTTKEDVALYIHTYGKLPSNFITKKEAEKLGWSGGSLEPYAPGKCIGGSHFGNYEGLLPDGDYKECDIDTLGKKKRGAKRIIYSDDGRIYYTDDHYESFTQLY